MQDSSTSKYPKGTRVGGHKNDQLQNFQTRPARAPSPQDPAPTISPPLTPPFSSGSLSQHDSGFLDYLEEVQVQASLPSSAPSKAPPAFNFGGVPVDSAPNSPVADMEVQFTDSLEKSPQHTTPVNADKADISSYSGSSAKTSPTYTIEEDEFGDDMDLDTTESRTGDYQHPRGEPHEAAQEDENDDSGVDTDNGSELGAPDDVEWIDEDIAAATTVEQEEILGEEELMGTEAEETNKTRHVKFNTSYNGERYSSSARLYKVAAKEFPFDGPMRPYPNWTLGVRFELLGVFVFMNLFRPRVHLRTSTIGAMICGIF